MKALKKLLKNHKNIIFLDLEGTQFSHEIIAIGAIKCQIDEKGMIIEKNKCETIRLFVKSLGQIGKVVQNMTHIDEEILKNEGISLEEAFDKFNNFINLPLDECSFIVFGSNDCKMILDSITYSKPNNEEIGFSIAKNSIDFLMFISQYVKDDNGNNYSLVNYLKVFGVEPYGISHDPLNDSIDLMNLYDAVNTKKDILLKEYLKVLQKQRIFPQPVKDAINRLCSGDNLTSDDFISDCKSYLE